MEPIGGVQYMIRTYEGLLKLLQLSFNLIGLIIIAATGTNTTGDAFIAASVIGLIVTGSFLICYVTNIFGQDRQPLWYRIEFLYCLIWSIFYIIVSSLCIAVVWGVYAFAGICGLLAALVYALDAYHKIKTIWI